MSRVPKIMDLNSPGCLHLRCQHPRPSTSPVSDVLGLSHAWPPKFWVFHIPGPNILGFLHPRSLESQISAAQVPPSLGLNILDLSSLGLNTPVSPPWVSTSLKNKHNPGVTGQTGAPGAEALATNPSRPQPCGPSSPNPAPSACPLPFTPLPWARQVLGVSSGAAAVLGGWMQWGAVVPMPLSPSWPRAPPPLHSSGRDWPYMAGSRLPCSRSDKSH